MAHDAKNANTPTPGSHAGRDGRLCEKPGCRMRSKFWVQNNPHPRNALVCGVHLAATVTAFTTENLFRGTITVKVRNKAGTAWI